MLEQNLPSPTAREVEIILCKINECDSSQTRPCPCLCVKEFDLDKAATNLAIF